MLTVDFLSNFNKVDISTLLGKVRVRCLSIYFWVVLIYGQETRLYLWDNILCQSFKCNKVTSWALAFFILCYTHLLIRLETITSVFLMCVILMMRISCEIQRKVAKTLDIILETGPRFSLELNSCKTEIFCIRPMVVNFVTGCSLQTLGDQCWGEVAQRGC